MKTLSWITPDLTREQFLDYLFNDDKKRAEFLKYVKKYKKAPPVFIENGYLIKSRYGDSYYFILEDNKWYFRGNWLYTRHGYDETGIKYIDPDGGPFIGINSKLGEYVSVLPEHNLTIKGFKQHTEKSWELITE